MLFVYKIGYLYEKVIVKNLINPDLKELACTSPTAE